MGHFLYLKKVTHQGWKRALMKIENGHLSTEKGHPSDFDKVSTRGEKGAFMKRDRSLAY